MKGLAMFLAATALAGPAVAGTISITISQAARIADGNLVVDVKVGNSGDEAALSVTPVLRFGDKEARGKGKPSLEPNGSFEETLTVPVGTLGEGRWPYRVGVDYTDQNQYPFQALQTQTIVVGNPPPGKVAVPVIKSEDITGTGTLTVAVKNLGPDTRTAKVSVLVPEGLEASDAVRSVTLEGWKDAELKVPVTNRTALVGSRYPVFVTAEYDDGPVHQGVVAQGIVAVVGADTFLDRNARALRIGAIALVAAWLAGTAVVFFRRRSATHGA
jgi:hypothetical protein